jgi:hypothetical protein
MITSQLVAVIVEQNNHGSPLRTLAEDVLCMRVKLS